ncbi:MAG: DUF6116 family protein [Myxococcota bacterium]
MSRARTPVVGALVAFASRLRFPTLFFVTAALFLVDLAVPDTIPFADEVLLGLGALVLSRWRKERREEREVHDVQEEDAT